MATQLHLEIESFFLFAKIFLDRIARYVELYFGPARGLSLDSHDDLEKHLEAYLSAKKIRSIPDNIYQLVKDLKRVVSDYRDYQIAHDKSPRTFKGTMFNLDSGKSRIVSHKLYPKEKDRQIESKAIIEVLELVQQYLQSTLSLFINNIGSSNLKVKHPR